MGEVYNRAGRIKQVTDESGTEWRYYGKLGEVLKEERQVNAHTPSMQNKKFTTEYVFDSFGRMTDMTYPDGEALHYAYDNGGLLKAALGRKERQPVQLHQQPPLRRVRPEDPYRIRKQHNNRLRLRPLKPGTHGDVGS